MGKHIDGNLLPIQLSARFGDGVGGELHCGGESVQTGVFLMDANMPHWVSPLQSGTLYSIITYIKKDSFWMADCATLAQLSSWGFPLRSVGLIVVLWALLHLSGAQSQSHIDILARTRRLYQFSPHCL